MPPGILQPSLPAEWNERVIEGTLLQHPALLAGALGSAAATTPLVLRQVDKIDLYLKADTDLHLLEIKRPSRHVEWGAAATQIARQWDERHQWLGSRRRTGVSVGRVSCALEPKKWHRQGSDGLE
jgi:hypothetical protein